MKPLATATDSYPTIDDFERLAFDPDAFDHKAHVFVGWEMVRAFPLTEAIDRYSTTLKRLTKKLNLAGKYHETTTWFFMILISERQLRTQAETWSDFAEANADLINESKELLESHYSKERLSSEHARQQFLMPDMPPKRLSPGLGCRQQRLI